MEPCPDCDCDPACIVCGDDGPFGGCSDCCPEPRTGAHLGAGTDREANRLAGPSYS